MDGLATMMAQNPWSWMILAMLLGISEIVVPGIFLIWIAIAAAVTGAVTLLTGIALPAQIVLFAVMCLVSTWAGRRWYAGNPVASTDPLLNDRAARLIGETVTVVEAIADGHGRVKVGDGVWNARGPNADVGAKVRVVGAEGTALRVERV
jgi:membrane protein implicated in regulation of membrane protease activity